MAVDLAWRDAVRAACEPVFEAAGAGFRWNEKLVFDEQYPSLLWEADPSRFAARYPDSGIEQSYGDQWPPPCIDYWVYVDPRELTARLSVEGWNADSDGSLELTGDAALDGPCLAAAFAAILRVAPG